MMDVMETGKRQAVEEWLPAELAPALRVASAPLRLATPYAISHYCVPKRNRKLQWAVKRVADRLLALAGLAFLALPLAAIALAIRLDSRGPVLFRQERIGAHGKRFTMYKFRSMHVDAEERLLALLDRNEANPAMFKLRHDPRVTRIGRFLRKYSLDEFPQLRTNPGTTCVFPPCPG